MNYDRASILSKFPWLDENQRAPITKLMREYGFRGAIRIVARTRRDLERKLDMTRKRGAEGSYLYDINFHLNLAHAVRCEWELGLDLIRLEFRTREFEKEAA